MKRTKIQANRGATVPPGLTRAGKGRPKGVPNKTTTAAKQAIQLAFDGIGGVPSLTVWAEANQSEFYKLYARLIPTEVSGPDGGHIPLGGADIDTLRKELLQLAKTPEIKKFLDSARL